MRISDWSSDVCSSDLRFPGSGKTGICRFDLCGGLGAEVFDGFQAIEANQAFGRRRAAFGSDIAVPAAKFPLSRDKRLANGERLPVVFLSHCALQEAASEFIRGSHMKIGRAHV